MTVANTCSLLSRGLSVWNSITRELVEDFVPVGPSVSWWKQFCKFKHWKLCADACDFWLLFFLFAAAAPCEKRFYDDIDWHWEGSINSESCPPGWQGRIQVHRFAEIFKKTKQTLLDQWWPFAYVLGNETTVRSSWRPRRLRQVVKLCHAWKILHVHWISLESCIERQVKPFEVRSGRVLFGSAFQWFSWHWSHDLERSCLTPENAALFCRKAVEAFKILNMVSWPMATAA